MPDTNDNKNGGNEFISENIFTLMTTIEGKPKETKKKKEKKKRNGTTTKTDYYFEIFVNFAAPELRRTASFDYCFQLNLILNAPIFEKKITKIHATKPKTKRRSSSNR